MRTRFRSLTGDDIATKIGPSFKYYLIPIFTGQNACFMIEDFRLRVFLKVAECGSFTDAARSLGVSQPAVSQNIAQLELAVGEPLFDRARGSVTLTERGRLFLDYARRILYWYERLDAVVVRKTEAPAEPVLLKVDDGKDAEVSVSDGEIHIRIK